MFKYEIALRMKNVGLKNLVGQPVQAIEGIGWVGKYQVELFVTEAQKVKHIVMYDSDIAQSQGRCL